MLELAILGLLESQELHGYEIRRRLRDELGLFSNISFGSLYPALSRLEQARAVEVVDAPAGSTPSTPSVPMTGSLSGERAALRNLRAAPGRSRRARRVYRITGDGRRQFVELLDAEASGGADDPRAFGLRLAFARHLLPQARLRLLQRRRVQLEERLAATRATAGSADLDPYARSLVEHTADVAEREISWIDGLIAGEERERFNESRQLEGEPR